MRRKRHIGANLGFSNERFLELLASLTGISPVGVLGRDTPLDLNSLEAARGSLLIRELFSKYDDGKPSPEKEAKTWERFHEAEQSCRLANQRIERWVWTEQPYWVAVRARIRKVLGSFSWDECSRFFAFGPGATTRLTRKESFAAYKYSGIPESTIGNAVLASCAIRTIPLWNRSVLLSGGDPADLVQIVPGNSIITVPKNYKTDRTIAKEPCMNIYIQKGIGRVIRHRLKKVGVDLDDQQPNQRAALIGSLTGLLATVDMSMASDTVARELIRWILPSEWRWALEQCRSPLGVLPSGEVIHYQKFSSMGNGYTFELESLIFWAIAQECARPFRIDETDDSICVYGDDVVIPTQFYESFCTRLAEVGFTPNPGKSFAEGPYRESCGKHYYHGIDITPFYVRKPVAFLHRLFLVHNNVYRWSARGDVEVTSVLNKLRELAPASWRKPRLPDGYGDGAFIGAIDELRLDSHPRGWECWQVKALAQCQTELSDDLPSGQLVASLKLLELGPIDQPHAFEVRKSFVGDPNLGNVNLVERPSGIPSREGVYREIDITIQRYSLVR